jgi:aminoglycoside phosphotransferase (APT) family kinase protein
VNIHADFSPAGYGHRISEFGTREVTRLDENRVVKTGGSFDSRETEAMKFVARNMTIPVPKVHALHFAGYGLDNHIVMEYMPGEPLDKVWRKLTTEQKEATCGQLGGYITQLQQLKGKRVEAANGEAIKICLSSTRNGGPFSTVREFNDWLVDGVFQRVTPKIWQDHCRASLSDNHEIVFAHGDFSPRNMLADPTGQITAVLDWGDGWLVSCLLGYREDSVGYPARDA